MKTCYRCRETKPFDAFTKDRSKSDGYRPTCNACRSDERRARYAENPDADKARSAANRAAKPGYNKAAMRKWYESNKTVAFDRAKKWNAENPAKRAEMSMRRVARKLHATPKWANIDKVKEYYVSADALRMLTGEWYNVDHIVPLQGRTVCGLHNEFNLQILTRAENIRKGNKHA